MRHKEGEDGCPVALGLPGAVHDASPALKGGQHKGIEQGGEDVVKVRDAKVWVAPACALRGHCSGRGIEAQGGSEGAAGIPQGRGAVLLGGVAGEGAVRGPEAPGPGGLHWQGAAGGVAVGAAPLQHAPPQLRGHRGKEEGGQAIEGADAAQVIDAHEHCEVEGAQGEKVQGAKGLQQAHHADGSEAGGIGALQAGRALQPACHHNGQVGQGPGQGAQAALAVGPAREGIQQQQQAQLCSVVGCKGLPEGRVPLNRVPHWRLRCGHAQQDNVGHSQPGGEHGQKAADHQGAVQRENKPWRAGQKQVLRGHRQGAREVALVLLAQAGVVGHAAGEKEKDLGEAEPLTTKPEVRRRPEQGVRRGLEREEPCKLVS